jgi:hypothetical protein
MAANNRTKLLRAIFDQGFHTPDWRHKQPPPVVSLEEFFEDNDDPESIAVNLADLPGVGFFYEKLKAIRANPAVKQVLVNIYDLDPIIVGGWPYSANVHILTSAAEDTIQAWAAELRSDGAMKGWPYGAPPAAEKEGEGFSWWSIAWD